MCAHPELALLHAPLSILVLRETGTVCSINNKALQTLGLDEFDAERDLHCDELLQRNLVVGSTSVLSVLSSLDTTNSCTEVEVWCKQNSPTGIRKPKRRRISVSLWLDRDDLPHFTVIISEEISVKTSTPVSVNPSPTGMKRSYTDLVEHLGQNAGVTPRGIMPINLDQKLITLKLSLSRFMYRADPAQRLGNTTASSTFDAIGREQLVWESFSFVADSLDIPIWMADSDPEPCWWNRKWLTTFAPGKSLNIHPDDEFRSDNIRSRSLAIQTPFEVLHRVLSADNEWRWFKTNWAPIFHPHDPQVCLRWVGNCQDVHDQLCALEDAELAREQLMLVIQQAGLYLYVYDTDLICKDFYGPLAATRTIACTGFPCISVTEPEVSPKGFHVSIQFANQEQLVMAMQTLLRGEQRQTQMDINLEGEFYRVQLTAVLEEGRVHTIIAFLMRITELKEQETAVEQAKMEAFVARQASLAKSQFISNTSHELRTPIAGILGLSSMIQDGPLTEQQRKLLSSLSQSADSLLAVVNDILDFSKIEAGKLLIESVPFDLESTIKSAVDIVAFAAQAKDVTICLTCDVPDRQVHGDPTRLRQILLNLLSNAIKFSQVGGSIKVNVESHAQDGNRLMVDFSVADHGLGMSAAVMGQLFQPFAQADSSTTRKYGGTGLGLVICSQLVTLMNGTIQLDSTENVGTRASFKLPFDLVTRLDLSRAQSRRKVSDRALKKISSSEKNILLVEDNAINRTIAMAALRKLGFNKVAIAENGVVACTRVESAEEPFDIILMDCQMPERDGYEATKIIRERHDTPIVAMIASAIQGDREACLAVGMSDYLSKPVKPAVLEAMLVKWLS